MGWQNQNTAKKVFTITRPLECESELFSSIPSEAIITAIERNTKSIKVTYVIDRTFTIEDIVQANQMTVKPLKLDRVGMTKAEANQKTKTMRCAGKVMAVVNIADFHLNRRVHGNETFGTNYDSSMAAEVFMRTIEQIETRLKSNAYQIDKIILNTAGDFINSDTVAGTTTAGTRQIDDVSWKQIFKVATSLLEFAIIRLSAIAPVEYMYVRGNHDEQIGFYLTSWLEARFRNVPNVRIDDCPRPRHVVKYGHNLLIFTHGESEGPRAIDLPFIEPAAFSGLSESTNIEVLSGHLHKNNVNTDRRVRWEILNSACPVQDEWTYGKAYDGTRQEATIMYYDDSYRVQEDHINTVRIMNDLTE